MEKDKVLIVEDDQTTAEVLRDYFKMENYRVSILNAGKDVVREVKMNTPDLILLDIMLPDKDGTAICHEIRSFSDVPIIFVTAKAEDIDRLLGLEIGADDYICKPFLPQEVVARARAIMRRVKTNRVRNIRVVGPLTLDDESHEVTINGAHIDLTPIEYNLLKIMTSAPNKVFTRADFISKIQGQNFVCYERTVDNHIKNLRKKMGAYLGDQEIIFTVYGVGYKINSQ